MNEPIFTYRLRKATAADYEFLYNLKVACLKEYITATWGWDETLQRARFAESFNPLNNQIIIVDEHDVGQLSLEIRREELYLSGIYILPAYQKRGLGMVILRDVLEKAWADDRHVRLQVLKVNPARRLYERLGFEVVEETETHYIMLAL